MISLILLKLITLSQILQGVHKLSSSTVCVYIYLNKIILRIKKSKIYI